MMSDVSATAAVWVSSRVQNLQEGLRIFAKFFPTFQSPPPPARTPGGGGGLPKLGNPVAEFIDTWLYLPSESMHLVTDEGGEGM